MNKLLSYIEQYGLLSVEKRDKLARLTGDHYFDLDLNSGKASFGGGMEFPVQIIGTQSDNTLTWLWAWSEEQAEVPRSLIRSSLELRDWGARHGIAEFTEPEIDLERADGGMISLIATAVCGASSAYRDPYESGSLFLLLFGNSIDSQPSFGLARLKQSLLELSADYGINPKRALLAYLRAKGISPTESGTSISCRLDSGEALAIEFDDQGKLFTHSE